MRILIKSQEVPAAMSVEAAPPVFPKPDVYVIEELVPLLFLVGVIVS
jgi:hypothetical protein